jgi:hypothetical protein
MFEERGDGRFDRGWGAFKQVALSFLGISHCGLRSGQSAMGDGSEDLTGF